MSRGPSARGSPGPSAIVSRLSRAVYDAVAGDAEQLDDVVQPLRVELAGQRQGVVDPPLQLPQPARAAARPAGHRPLDRADLGHRAPPADAELAPQYALE